MPRHEVILSLNIPTLDMGRRLAMLTSTLTKWGNSQGIILPKSVCEDLRLKPGDKLNLQVVDGELRARPVGAHTIHTLLEGYDGPVPDRVDYWEGWGGPVGKEMW